MLSQVYDYNLQAYSPAGASGRPFDPQRDLTFHRKNLRTPKQQRASSCPTQVQPASRICPRPSQSVSNSPIRSISPSERNKQHHPGTMQQRSPEILAKYPTTPVCRPTRTPVCQVDETSVHSPGTETKTITTITTMEVSSITVLPKLFHNDK